MAKDNHPGRAGGEHASSKNSKDAGDRARGGGGGGGSGNGKLALSDPKLEAARQAAFNSPKGMATRSLDTPTNERDFRATAKDAEDDGMFGLFDFFSPITELSPWKGYWSPGQTEASYGANPASLLGGAAGAALGVPLAGSLLGKAYSAANGPMIDMGPSVFGSDNLGSNLRDINSLSNGGWGQSPGGGNPSNPQGNRGSEGGLLQPTQATQPGVTPLAPVSPAAQPAAQQAKERQKRMYALNGVNIPGPTPYSFTGAKWL